MTLQQRINEELKTAMKSAAADRVAVLRLLNSGFKNEQIKLGRELSEEETLKAIQREAKQRKDSIDAYSRGGREDLAAEEKAELTIIEEFLPTQMSVDELTKIVDEVIAETGASSPAQMGQVIGAVVKLAEGRADGGTISQVVRQKLTNG